MAQRVSHVTTIFLTPNMAFRQAFRALSTSTRSTLKIGLIPADGIGHEVIPVRDVSYHPTCLHVRLMGRLPKKPSLH